MLKKTALILTLVVVASTAFGIYLYFGNEYVIELNQFEVQRAFDIAFPVEKTYLHLIKVDLSNPAVTLRETSERIAFSVNIGVGMPGVSKPMRGTAALSCQIRYDPDRAAFFADDPKVERLTIEGHPEGYLDNTRGAVTWIVKGVFEHTPVYTLPVGELRHSIAKLILKDVRVKNGKLRLTLGVNR